MPGGGQCNQFVDAWCVGINPLRFPQYVKSSSKVARGKLFSGLVQMDVDLSQLHPFVQFVANSGVQFLGFGVFRINAQGLFRTG